MDNQDVNNDVQIGAASQDTGVVSDTVVTPEANATEAKPDVKQETQPLTQEAVAKMIEDSVASLRESSKRDVQSAKDKVAAEVERALRKAQLAESTLNQVRGRLKEADPAFAQELEIAELRTKDQHYQQREQEDRIRREQEKFDQSFKETKLEILADYGIDPTDKRIDWGDDANNYLERNRRIDKSIAKAIKDDARKTEEKRSQEVKAIEARLRKELGLDSVDTSTPGNIAAPKTASDLDSAFAEGRISYEAYSKKRKELSY